VSSKSEQQHQRDVVIIGAGIAGLTAAAFLARAGRSVIVFETSGEVGGRARTSIMDGFYFNHGAHALYLQGHGVEVLHELGVAYTGKKVGISGYVIKQGKKYPLPSTPFRIFSSNLLKGLGSKIEAIRFFSSLNKINFDQIQNVTLQDWIDENIHHSDFSDLVKMYCRLTTYTNDVESMSAGAALKQLQMAASGGVVYLDRGWQSLVNGLVAAAQDTRKVRIVTGKRVMSIANNDNSLSTWTVNFSDGTKTSASKLIMATSPMNIWDMLKHNYNESSDSNRDNGYISFFSRMVKEISRPVRAACLDIALNKLPNPKQTFALDIDHPLYLSVHSKYAKLTPEDRGGALVHLLKYLGSGIDPNPKNDRKELEDVMDLIQPGWQYEVIRERFLPNMIVFNSSVTASRGGIGGRPNAKVANAENLYMVGDWVGPKGLLSDASFSSAKDAAQLILEEKS
jgi:phytoene dehydrogenase-like protein